MSVTLVVLLFGAGARAGASTEPSRGQAPAPAGRGISTSAIGRAPEVPVADEATGPVAPSRSEAGAVVLRPRDESALTSFITSVTDKRSALYHQYLAAGAFYRRFGPRPAIVREVEATLRADGLDVSGRAADGLLVFFKASAERVEEAFRTGIEAYRLPSGSKGQATTSAPRVPAALRPYVAGVLGLDDLVQEQPTYSPPEGGTGDHAKASSPQFSHPSGSPDPCSDAVDDAESSGGLTDDAIADAYGAFGLYRDGDFGLGQTVAIFELQPFLSSDITTFDTCYFGSKEAAEMADRVTVVPVDGGLPPAADDSANDEATLDVEDVSALAPEADIDVYEAPNTSFGSLDDYATIVNEDKANVVSSSWGACEQMVEVAEPGMQEAEDFLFQQAAAQGQTVLAAAGDEGDDSCNVEEDLEPPSGQNLLSVLDPASQPYALAVGGTTINDATQPPQETVWNDGAEGGGGGGGISQSWEMPSWQESAALTQAGEVDVKNAEAFEEDNAAYESPFATPDFCDSTASLPAGTPCREVPDVSAQADEYTGAITIYGQSLGYGPANGWATIGGTSSATPIWAAVLALVNGSSACSDEKVNGVPDAGFASPILYGIAASPTAYAASFNDIVEGDNDVYGLDNGLLFPARAGYDMASGLGSPQLTTPSGGDGLAFYMCQYAAEASHPAVTGLSPTSGSTAGGYTVTVEGSGFGTPQAPAVASVGVGNSVAAQVTVLSDDTLSATFPAAASATAAGSPDPTDDGAGPAEVTVTSTSGQSSAASSSAVFDYVDEEGGSSVPSVTGVGPQGGLESTASPGSVRVYGSGFEEGTVSAVDFGGVAGSNVDVLSPYELTVDPPPFSELDPSAACPTDDGGPGQPLSPTSDVCQVEVTVTVAGATSATATILPPYEGAETDDSLGVPVVPAGCGCEEIQQTTEYDYVPAPTVTAVSTVTSDAASLASEFGGSSTNTITVEGTGMDPLTFSYATLGTPLNEDAMAYPLQESGTSMTIEAPAILALGSAATTNPVSLPVGFASTAGQSNLSDIVYAGVPEVTKVVDTATGKDGVPDSVTCPSPPPAAGCGVPLTVTGTAFQQVTGPIGFVDNVTGLSLGTQYTYRVVSDDELTTQSVDQNPAVVDVELCSVTGCSYNPPDDELYVYPPGNPVIDRITPATGPAHGGGGVDIYGQNLGCAVSVSFGSVTSESATNSAALLDCGTTNEVVALVPPARKLGEVKVRVATVESILSSSPGSSSSESNAVSYRYVASAPSSPGQLRVLARPGSALVAWSPPATDGGSPVTGYHVEATASGEPTILASVGRTTRKHTFAFLQPGISWNFSVWANSARGRSAGSSASNIAIAPGDNGYLVATARGPLFGFGSLSADGRRDLAAPEPVVAMAAIADGLGAFEVSASGDVYAVGAAQYFGSVNLSGARRIVAVASTADGQGYWLLSNTGRVYAFGDAPNLASRSGVHDAVAMATTPDGQGYYVVGANGVVKAFGDAVFSGDLVRGRGGTITAIAVNQVNGGYWLLASDGKVSSFGGAGSFGSVASAASVGSVGSAASRHLRSPAVGIEGTPDGRGYWIVTRDGEVFGRGSAKYVGSARAPGRGGAVGVAD